MNGSTAERGLGIAGNRPWLWAGLAVFFITTLLPLVVLAWDTLALALKPATDGPDPGWAYSARQLTLLGRSLGYATAVSLCSLLIGCLAALGLWQWRRPPGVWLRWLVPVLIVVPPYAHTEAWTNLVESVSRWTGASALFPLQTGGLGAAIAVQSLACLPLTTGLALLGLSTINPRLVDAAATLGSPARMLGKVAIPLAAPQLLAGACLAFVLSLADYSVPSLFQQNIYALELFTGFSQDGSPGYTFWRSLPQIIPAVAVVWFALSGLTNLGIRQSVTRTAPAPRIEWPGALQLVVNAALLVLALQVVVPLASLVAGTESLARLSASVTAAHREILTSLLVAAITALAVLPGALAMAVLVSSPGRLSRLWWLVCFIPLAIPAPLAGIGLIHLWNQPWAGPVYGSLAMPVLASLARYTPIAVLTLATYLRHLDPAPFDAAAVYQRSAWQTWLRIRLPLLAPGLMASASIVAALTLGELGATLLVAPPARATLTMRIYNYMHYGSSESVAGLCLVMTAGVLLCGAAAAWGIYRLGRARRFGP